MFTHRFAHLLRSVLVVALAGALGCSGQINGGMQSGGTGGVPTTGGTGGVGVGSGGAGAIPGSGGANGTGSGGVGSGTGGGGVTTGTGGSGPTACTALPSVQRRLWRLSAGQWSNSVKDLLRLSAAPAVSSTGGDNQYAFFSDTTLGVSPEFQYALYDATQQTVLPAIASKVGGAQGTIAPCSGTTAAAQTTCAQTFIQAFAKKAYRRPVDATEITNLMKVYAQGAMQDYATGVELMIQAVLISPSFVYRTELGPSTLTADATGKFPDTDADRRTRSPPSSVSSSWARSPTINWWRRPTTAASRRRTASPRRSIACWPARRFRRT